MSGLSTAPRSVRGDDQEHNQDQDLELKDLDPELARPAPLDSGAAGAGKYGVVPPRRRGVVGMLERGMDLLVRYGVEERGIQPRPGEVRDACCGLCNLLITGLVRVRLLYWRSHTRTTRSTRSNWYRPAEEECDMSSD